MNIDSLTPSKSHPCDKTLHQSPTNAFIWCSNLFWEVQSCPKLQKHKELRFKCSTTSCPGFSPGSNTWNMHCHKEGALCVRKGREEQSQTAPLTKLISSPSQQNSLLCLKFQGELFGLRMTDGSCCPSANKPHLPLLPMSKCSGAHLSAWRIIKVLIALLLTGIQLPAFLNHSRAISKLFKLSCEMLWRF